MDLSCKEVQLNGGTVKYVSGSPGSSCAGFKLKGGSVARQFR